MTTRLIKEKIRRPIKETRLLTAAMITPDGTRLISQHIHEMASHIDDNGEFYFIDGIGSRHSDNDFPATLIDVYDTDSHDKIREWFRWSSYDETGKSGIIPIRYTQLMDMEESHIKAILTTQTNLPQHIKKVFVDEFHYRKKNLT